LIFGVDVKVFPYDKQTRLPRVFDNGDLFAIYFYVELIVSLSFHHSQNI